MNRLKNGLIYFLFLFFVLNFNSCRGSVTENYESQKPKYIFIFIGDGMGHNHISMMEAYYASVNQTNGFTKSKISRFPIFGDCTTHCKDNLITDSGAAGSAIACGEKNDFGAISYFPWFSDEDYPLSIAKIAKQKNYKVGIISNVSIDHATPSAFYAINEHRRNYYEIGLQLKDSKFDFFGGGGFKYPIGRESNREDLYQLTQNNGYFITSNLQSIMEIDKTQYTGVYFKNSILLEDADMPYSIDRDFMGGESLADIVKTAIEYLYNDKGFLIMVEGGKIDWAAHENDAATIIYELEDFDNAVFEAYKFLTQYPEETLIIVTSDHETGGLSLGNSYQSYNTNLSILSAQKISMKYFSSILDNYKISNPNAVFDDILNLINTEFLKSDIDLSIEEMQEISTAYNHYFSTKTNLSKKDASLIYGGYNPIAITVCKIISRKAGVGFTSWDHTASKVPVYSIGARADFFSGQLDNTDFNKKLRYILNW